MGSTRPVLLRMLLQYGAGIGIGFMLWLAPWLWLRTACLGLRYSWWEASGAHEQQLTIERQYHSYLSQAQAFMSQTANHTQQQQQQHEQEEEGHGNDETASMPMGQEQGKQQRRAVCVAMVTRSRPTREYIGITLPLLVERWPFHTRSNNQATKDDVLVVVHGGAAHPTLDALVNGTAARETTRTGTTTSRNRKRRRKSNRRQSGETMEGKEATAPSSPARAYHGLRDIVPSPRLHITPTSHHPILYGSHNTPKLHAYEPLWKWQERLSFAHADAIRACARRRIHGQVPYIVVIEDDALPTRHVGAKIHTLLRRWEKTRADHGDGDGDGGGDGWFMVRLFASDFYLGWQFTLSDVLLRTVAALVLALLLHCAVRVFSRKHNKRNNNNNNRHDEHYRSPSSLSLSFFYSVSPLEIGCFVATTVSIWLMLHAVGKQNLTSIITRLAIRTSGAHIVSFPPDSPSTVAAIFNPRVAEQYASFLDKKGKWGELAADQVQNLFSVEHSEMRQYHAVPDVFQHIGAHSSSKSYMKGRGKVGFMKTSPTWIED